MQLPTVERSARLQILPPSADRLVQHSSSRCHPRQSSWLTHPAARQHRLFASLTQARVEPVLEIDAHNHERLQYREKGWNYWKWQNHCIHYITAGPEDGPPIVLVHGFGASAYHWRYNIPDLAKKYRVYAVDLLGFGWSDKALVSYDGYTIWQEQLSDFIKQQVGGKPVVLVGNSLGGYNSLATAAQYPELVRGVVLVNAAGRFEEVKEAVEAPIEAALTGPERAGLEASLELASDQAALSASEPVREQRIKDTQRHSARWRHREDPDPGPSKPFGLGSRPDASPSLMQRIVSPLKTMAMRTAVFASFIAAKQPSRIRSVLKQVYTDDTNIDDELAGSMLAALSSTAATSGYQSREALRHQLEQGNAALPGHQHAADV
ncbi:hypothetical protein WJX84_012261 [Apatococcus fuscideae]|uniref:AB hydrolase-1 domain-containing protein n=1 Tax=Apatococcus fuscideae TaxID=2026836 RepID=A0AAW1SQY3_9CHLO